jgi:predicted HicB family RNase H-like nuclease
MPALKPRPKKPGRPKMAKGEAKGSIVPVRFSPEDRKRVEAAARASGQTISAWVRSTLSAAIGA